ncbi:MAG: DUF3783 domain-containing protein [Calditrichaeota bacterium]|nr:DUF3783 domain-containing protein [Calditrichota bacterium]
MSNNEDGTFKKVGQSEQRFFGPRKVLVCGLGKDLHARFLSLIEELELSPLPAVFVTTQQANEKMADLFALPENSGLNEPSKIPLAVVMAGITEKELHTLIRGYRAAGLPAPLWATLTPTTENWKLSDLTKELAAEREEIRKMQEKQRK